jgi:putative flippase GtrA
MAGDGSIDGSDGGARDPQRRRYVAMVRAALRTRQLRYLMVGGYNTGVGYLVFGALLLIFDRRVHYTVLLVASWVIGTLNAFVAYRVMVFQVQGHFFRDLVRFSSVYLVALAVNLVLLPLVVALSHLPVLLAQGVVLGFTTIGTYAAHQSFSFRRPDAVVGAPADPAE